MDRRAIDGAKLVNACRASGPGTLRRCSRRTVRRVAATAAGLALLSACGPKAGNSGPELTVEDGKILTAVTADVETVFASTRHVLVQERIFLRRYEPESGFAETDFIDLASYRDFDRELWDNTERLVKLRFYASAADSTTVLVCEPLYNPYEVVTDESDSSRLRLVPFGHPGFDIAAALTRRIAAHAQGQAVTRP